MGFNISERENQRRELLLAIVDLGGDDNEVLVRATPNMTVSRRSMKTLTPGRWLNDEIIIYYFRVVLTELDEDQWMNSWEYRRPSLFYSTYFL